MVDFLATLFINSIEFAITIFMIIVMLVKQRFIDFKYQMSQILNLINGYLAFYAILYYIEISIYFFYQSDGYLSSIRLHWHIKISLKFHSFRIR